MHSRGQHFQNILGSILLLLISACTSPPPKSLIEKAIVQYFRDSNYAVQDLVITDINRIPIKERQYMGAPGYVVHISKLAINLLDDQRLAGASGTVLNFENVIVRVKEHSSRAGVWMVTNISGVSFDQ